MEGRAARSRRQRAALLLSAALAPAAALAPLPALAQATPPTPPAASAPTDLPNVTDVVAVSGADVLGGTNTATPTALTVNVTNRTAFVDWSHFNVPANTSAAFVNTSGASKAAILNRVVGDLVGADRVKTATTLGGALFSRDAGTGEGVEVWIANTAGILLGPNGAINTQGLVATTLDLDPSDFVSTGTGGLRLSAPAGGGSGITGGGASFQINSGNGVLALIAPAINVRGDLVAGAGTAAFVTAADVTMSRPGSPLSLVVAGGTGLAGGQVITGTVDAGNAYFVLSRQDVVNALLRVDATVTAASGGNGVVVLGGPGAIGAAEVVPSAATDAAVDVTVTGALRTGTAGTAPIRVATSGDFRGRSVMSAAGNLSIAAAGSASQQGRVDAGGDAVLSAGGTLEVIGDVGAGGAATLTAGNALDLNSDVTSGGAATLTAIGALRQVGSVRASGAYVASGASVVLSGFANAVYRGAGVTITGTDGVSTGLGAVSIEGGAGTVAVSSAAGDLALGQATLSGGAATLEARAGAVTLGRANVTGDYSVAARAFGGAALSPTLGGSLSITDTDGALVLGALSVPGALTVANQGAIGLSVNGALSAVGGVASLSSATGITLGADVAGRDGVTLTGPVALAANARLSSTSGPVTVAGTISGARALTVAAGGAVTLGEVGSAGVPLSSLTVERGTAVTLGAVTASGAVTLGQAATPLGSLAVRGAISAESLEASVSGDAVLGDVASPGAVSITSTGGRASFGILSGTGAKVVRGATGVSGSRAEGQDAAATLAAVTGEISLNSFSLNSLSTEGGDRVVLGVLGGSSAVADTLRVGAAPAALVLRGGISAGTLDVAGAGAVELSGAALGSSGVLSLARDVTVTSASSLASTGGLIAFEGALDGPGALTLTAGTVRLGGAVGGTSELGALTVTGATTLAGGTVRTAGAQAYNGSLSLAADATLASSAGDVTVTGAVGGGGRALSVSAAGAVTLGAAGTGAAPLGSLTIARGGAVTLASADVAGAVTLGQAATPLGSLVVRGAISAGSLEASVSGDAVLGDVASPGAVSITSLNGQIGAATLSGGGPKLLMGDAGVAVTRAEGAGSVTLRARTGDASIGSFDVGALTVSGGERAVIGTIGAVGSVAGALTVGDAGTLGAAALRGALSAGTIRVAAGAITMDGASATTSGAQLYVGPVTLGSDATLTSTGWSVTLTGAVAGPGGLALSSGGDATLGGPAGSAAAPLAFLRVERAVATRLAGGVIAGALELGNTAPLASLVSVGTLLADSVTGAVAGDAMLGDLTAAGAAVLSAGGALTTGRVVAASALLSAGGDALINGGAVNGDFALEADGDVGVTADLSAGGRYRVEARNVRLTGAHRSGGAMTLSAADAVSAASGATITSDGGNSGAPLVISAAQVLLGGATVSAGEAGRSAIRFDAVGGTGGVVELGALLAGRIDQSTAGGPATEGTLIRDGDLRFGRLALSGTGPATIGAGGLLTVAGDLALAGSASLSGAAGLTVAGRTDVNGALSLVSAGGDAVLGDAAVAGGLSVAARTSVRVGAVTGAGDRAVRAGGDVTIASVDGSGAVALDAGGALTIGGLGRTTAIGGVTLEAGGAVTLGKAGGAGGTALASRGNVLIGQRAPVASLTINGAATATGRVDARVAGAVVVDAVNAGGDMAVTARTSIVAGSLESAGGSVRATADSVGVERAVASGALLLTAVNNLRLGDGRASGDAEVASSGTAVLRSLVAEGTARVSAGGSAAIGSIAGRTVAADANVLGVGVATAGDALTLRARAGDLRLDRAAAGGVTAIDAAGAATVGTARAGRALLLRAGGRASAGSLVSDASDVTVTAAELSVENAAAGGALTFTSERGDLSLGTGVAGGAATLASAGSANVEGLRAARALLATARTTLSAGSLVSAASSVTARAASLRVDGAAAAGDVSLAAGSGELRLGDVTAGGAAMLEAAREVALVSVRAVGAVSVAAGDAVSAGTIGSRDAGVSVAGASAAVDRADAGGALVLTARDGDLRLDTGMAGEGATLQSAGAMTLGTVLAERSVGVTAGAALRATSLQSRAAAVAATAASMSVGRATVATDLMLRARSGDLQLAAGTAGGAVALTAAGGAALGTVQGSAVTAQARGAAEAEALTSTAGAVTGSAASVSVGRATAALALTLTAAAGDVRLGTGSSGGATALAASGTAFLGAVTAGGALTARAADAVLGGVLTAPSVTLTNTAASRGTALGDDAGAGGFSLSQAEFDLIQTPLLDVDAGTGAARIGALRLATVTGSRSAAMLGTGSFDVVGSLSGASEGRTFLIGGAAGSDAARARSIVVTATASGGGRLLLGGADLELRADRIAAGQAAGFLSTLNTTNGGSAAAARSLVANSGSALYDPALAGTFYAPGAQTLVAARNLTVRFSDYALFQNTGLAGTNAGVAVGTAAAPGTLSYDAGATSGNAFALFGTVNGVGDVATALLGPRVLVAGLVDPTSARINGCLIGSGAGCLTSTLAQPSINVFDASRLDLFRSADDLAVPFDPLIGSGNEALFSAITFDAPLVEPECVEGNGPTACLPPRRDGQ